MALSGYASDPLGSVPEIDNTTGTYGFWEDVFHDLAAIKTCTRLVVSLPYLMCDHLWCGGSSGWLVAAQCARHCSEFCGATSWISGYTGSFPAVNYSNTASEKRTWDMDPLGEFNADWNQVTSWWQGCNSNCEWNTSNYCWNFWDNWDGSGYNVDCHEPGNPNWSHGVWG